MIGRISGKFWGFIIGFLFFRSPGAVVGLVLGHLYDIRILSTKKEDRRRRPRYNQRPEHLEAATYTIGVIVLGAKMAKADGRVSRAEIDAFKRVFRVRESEVDKIAHIFDEARKSVGGFEPYAMRLAQVFRRNPAVLEEILTGLFLIAASDSAGAVSPAEANFLSRVAVLFDFSVEDFVRIAARSGVILPGRRSATKPQDSAYVVLGLDPGASEVDIKKTYRALIRKHHPDALVAQGLPKELIEQATEKMKRINEAYANICKARGIK